MLKGSLQIRNEDISKVLIAGAFGNYVNKKSVQKIGILSDFPEEKIEFAGNTSSKGAKMALLSLSERKRAEEAAGRVECIDLSSNIDFSNEFIEASSFPG